MTFPALTPSTRTYTPGDVPSVNHVAQNGLVTGFRRANRIAEQKLSLGFTNLTEAQVDLIKNHYIDRNGSFDIFFLSSDVWSGYVVPPVGLFSNTAWRYANSPKISDGIVGRWNVDVEFDSYQILQGDLLLVTPGNATGSDPASQNGSDPAVAAAATYIFDALTSSASPTRSLIIDSGAS